MGISQLSNGSRLVTKSGLMGGDLLPNNTGTSGTTSTSDQTYGAWWTITSSTSQEYLITAVTARLNGNIGSLHGPIILDLGMGGAGSEQRLDTALIYGSEANQTSSTTNTIGGTVNLPVALRIPAGSRLAARAAMYVNGGQTATVIVIFHVAPYANLE